MSHTFDPLQTPREDRSARIEPSCESVPAVVRENRNGCHSLLDADWNGRSFAAIRRLAREELLAAARCWTSGYRDVPSEVPTPDAPLLLTGHQPQMVHPGVWFKNFALDAMARQGQATAVHLIIDSDVMTVPSIAVPGGTVASPVVAMLPFDRTTSPLPFEERTIEDREVFASFGRRAAEHLRPLVPHPLLEQYWPLVCERAKHTDRLGACLAQARHQLEAAWGLETLEVPLSTVASGEAFAWFVAHVLARLPEFRKIHNEAIREYRREHHVRSTSHPAPELATDGDWLEAPFWVGAPNALGRRRLFVRAAGRELVLSDRQTWEDRLPLWADGNASQAVERLLAWGRNGLRIRPRALMTTLWARLALSDLFVHGIGGAKYDRVTDRLIERLFGITPPTFGVVSATLLLPIPHEPPCPDALRQIGQTLRELTYHPEKYCDADASIAEKRRWIATRQTRDNAKERCQAIRHANAALQARVAECREHWQTRQQAAELALRAEAMLASREYAFCLHPETNLRAFFRSALQQPPFPTCG
jgi:hypothetical protein